MDKSIVKVKRKTGTTWVFTRNKNTLDHFTHTTKKGNVYTLIWEDDTKTGLDVWIGKLVVCTNGDITCVEVSKEFLYLKLDSVLVFFNK